MILAIDPGTDYSAYIQWDGRVRKDMGKIPNKEIFPVIRDSYEKGIRTLVIEKITLYQPANNYIHDTILWYGKFTHEWETMGGTSPVFICRSDVKKTLLKGLQGKHRKDGSIISYLTDRFGAKGTKKNPNPVTYGMSADVWQAFALAVYYMDCYEVQKIA